MQPKIFREYVYLQLLRNCTFLYTDFACSSTFLQMFLPHSMAPGQRLVTFFLKLDSKTFSNDKLQFYSSCCKARASFLGRGNILKRKISRQELCQRRVNMLQRS